MPMHVQSIDPRDTETEEDRPAYRVYFWERLQVPAHIPPEVAGHMSTEYELTDAESVHEVLAWAEATARPDQTFVLYVRTLDHRLVRLAGTDPTSHPPEPSAECS